MAEPERHVRLALERVGEFGGRRVIRRDLVGGPRPVHDQPVQHASPAPAHLGGLGEGPARRLGLVALVVRHARIDVVRHDHEGLRGTDHVTRFHPQPVERHRIALLRHDAARARQRALAQQDPRPGLVILRVEILREAPGGGGEIRREPGQFQAHIQWRELARVVAVLHGRIEAEQIRQALAIHREARRPERRRAEGREVQARPGLAQAVRVARERPCIAEEIVAEGRRLGLHAVGVGGDDRVRLALRHREQGRAGRIQGLGQGEEAVALLQLQHRRDDVLAAAAGMHPRGVRTGDGGDQRLDLQVVVGTLGPRLGGIGGDLIEGAGDGRPKAARDDAGLHRHHQRGPVDRVDAGEGVPRLGAGTGGEQRQNRPDRRAPHRSAPCLSRRPDRPFACRVPIHTLLLRCCVSRLEGGCRREGRGRVA